MKQKSFSVNSWLLTTKQAAERICMTPRYLEAARINGDGPPFVKLGKSVRYRVSDIEKWVEQNTHLKTLPIVEEVLFCDGRQKQLTPSWRPLIELTNYKEDRGVFLRLHHRRHTEYDIGHYEVDGKFLSTYSNGRISLNEPWEFMEIPE